MKKHWAYKILNKSINHMNNKFKIPKFLRLPTPVDLGKSTINALPWHFKETEENKNDYTWKSYEAEMCKDYPIKYFIYYTLDHWFSRNIIKPIVDFKYYIVSHTIRKYHLLDLRSKEFGYSYGWRDSDTQMLLAMMRIMENFIVEQDTVNRIVWLKEELAKDSEHKEYNWADSIKFCEELLAIQKWWRVDRAKNWELEENRDYDLTNPLDYFNGKEKLTKEDDEMMKKLIDIRGGMWT